ncbi:MULTISPECIES: ABC transporter permease [unclassified Agarivorans]|uniref:ABC transporter permease n=1 Tax=unclassified Agarivorans TaxID=2636026 RepID=UPI0026E3A5BD|nr:MULTISPECIES: ABC transporter permease [unclassified Agarivorans]MDO6684222.1 ABC transporter permease [Agarivorans sp. 3_MG-2023]MDO6714044.1 ABC transporter permease [Agarivorans sp. 2_MG-2023]
MKAKGLGFYLLLLPFVLWFVLLIVLPHLQMFELSLIKRDSAAGDSIGMYQYQQFFEEPLYWRTLVRTVWMSLLATFITLLVSFPVAFFIAKVAKGKSKRLLLLSCLLPFWVSELVRTYGWMILLRESGVISQGLLALGLTDQPIEFLYNDISMLIGLVYTSMLFMVVPLVSTLEGLDQSLIEAGYDLGGNGWNVTHSIIVPYAMPGIVSGCIMVFMLCLGNYLTPRLLGGKDSLWFTEQIFTQFITRFNWELGAAFGVVLLVVSSLVVSLGLKLSGQSFSRTLGR